MGKTFPAALRTIAIGSSVFLSSCAPMLGPSEPPSQLDVQVEYAPRAAMDPELERQSKSLHHYMVGQLAYNHEDFKSALDNLDTAGQLIEKPVAGLNSRLAELYVREGDLSKALEESDKALIAEPDSREVLLLRAGILEAMNRPEDAVPIYGGLIQTHPDDVEARILLANTYLKKKEGATAVALLKKLSLDRPQEPLAHYYLGLAYEDQGSMGDAMAALRKAYTLTKSSDMAVDLMRVLVKEKKLSELKAVCEEVLRRDPNNLTARRVLGEVLIGQHQVEAAREHFKVLETNEKDPTNTRFKIAIIDIERQDFTEAIRELSLVLAQSPKHDEARYTLGSLFASTGRTGEAINELMKMEPDEKLYAKGRTLAALLLRQQDRFSEAEKAAREAYEASPGDHQSFSYLVLILMDNRKYDEAERLLEAALEKDPNNEKLHFSYGTLLSEMGKPSESVQAMERVIQINPRNSDALNFAAYTMAESSSNLDQATDYINKALEIRPNDGFYLDTLGWIYYRQNRLAEANTVLEKAVNSSGGDPEILEHFGDVLRDLGDLRRAKEIYASALEKLSPGTDQERRKQASKRLERKIDDLSRRLEAQS